MLLYVKGLAINDDLSMHVFGFEKRPKPSHLSPVGETLWPDYVKKEISRLFKEIGVEDPLKQKLVEPFALAFGGNDNDGAYDLENVNWEMVMDYFKWESSAWTAVDRREAHMALTKEIIDRWGGLPCNHEQAYSDWKTWY